MPDQYISKSNDFIKNLPGWAEEFATKYGTKTANLYILHGNIRDFLPHEKKEGEFIFRRVQDYISEILFGNRDIIAYYDRSSGVSFCEPEMERDYLSAVTAIAANSDIDKSDFLSSNPEACFPYLEKYFLSRIPKERREKCRMVLIIDYAEHIVPAGDLIRLDAADRFCMVTFNRWATDPNLLKGTSP